jgi:hypothetical protein
MRLSSLLRRTPSTRAATRREDAPDLLLSRLIGVDAVLEEAGREVVGADAPDAAHDFLANRLREAAADAMRWLAGR